MARKGVLSGKVSKSHATYIEESEQIIVLAKKHLAVSKVALGIIKPAKPAKPRIKINRLISGLEIKIRGHTAVQTLYVFTNSPDEIEILLTNEFTQTKR